MATSLFSLIASGTTVKQQLPDNLIKDIAGNTSIFHISTHENIVNIDILSNTLFCITLGRISPFSG